MNHYPYTITLYSMNRNKKIFDLKSFLFQKAFPKYYHMLRISLNCYQNILTRLWGHMEESINKFQTHIKNWYLKSEQFCRFSWNSFNALEFILLEGLKNFWSFAKKNRMRSTSKINWITYICSLFYFVKIFGKYNLLGRFLRNQARFKLFIKLSNLPKSY